MKKLRQIFFFFYLFPVVAFATQQVRKKFELSKHSKAKDTRRKIVENWYRKSRIKTVQCMLFFPLELVGFIEKYSVIDKMDLIFLFNDAVVNVNKKIKKINSSNRFFQFIDTINKVNNFHNFDELHMYLLTLDEINRDKSFLHTNEANKDLVYLHDQLVFFDISTEDDRSTIFRTINRKVTNLNKEIYRSEQLYKIENQEINFCGCM